MSTLHHGDEATNFERQTSVGPIRFQEWAGDARRLSFSQLTYFGPVCATKLGLASKLASGFAKRNLKAIASSVDDVASPTRRRDGVEQTQNVEVRVPVIADAARKVATLYDMVHPSRSGTATMCSVFVIDAEKKVRWTPTCPMSVSGDFDEIRPVSDAPQSSETRSVAIPGNWRDGDEAIIPLVTRERGRDPRESSITRSCPTAIPALQAAAERIGAHKTTRCRARRIG